MTEREERLCCSPSSSNLPSVTSPISFWFYHYFHWEFYSVLRILFLEKHWEWNVASETWEISKLANSLPLEALIAPQIHIRHHSLQSEQFGLSTNISLNLFLPCSHSLCTRWENRLVHTFSFWASETWVERKCCWLQLLNTTFLTWCSKGMMQLCSPCSSHLFFVVFLSFGNIANKAKKYFIHVCSNLTWWHRTISWCGYDGQQMNHCYYKWTVKTLHAPQSSAGLLQFGLSLWPSHWCCG